MEDFAVIIGLDTYTGLGKNLSGAEADAHAFKAYLTEQHTQQPTSSDGFEVWQNTAGDKINIRSIVSSDYPGPATPGTMGGRPAFADIKEVFLQILKISIQNSSNLNGSSVGRKLYIFMAGHGMAPNQGDESETECALILANVTQELLGHPDYHIPGTYTANWYKHKGCFEEVFLFMDCCRERIIVPFINNFFPRGGSNPNTKYFFAFATKWTFLAREIKIDGAIRGVFSTALIRGLKGEAAVRNPLNPTQGIINYGSLESYLIRNMKKLFGPQAKDDPKVQEPVCFFDKSHPEYVISTMPLPETPVMVNKPPNATTGDAVILSDSIKQIIRTLPVNQLPTEVNLAREQYLVYSSNNSFIPFVISTDSN